MARRLSRRRFLGAGAALGLVGGLTLGGCGDGARAGAATGATRVVRGPRRLGATDLEIPPVSFGSFALRGDTELVRRALDRGVTHFDTAANYTDGDAERTLGKALAGDRQRITITTKHAAQADESADQLMAHLDASLERLRTDYVDVYFNHALDDVDRLRNPGWVEFVERAKSQGKIRYSGLSGHGPSLGDILREAFETDWLDAILVAYNYVQSPTFLSEAKLELQRLTGRLDWVAQQPELPALLAEAHGRGIGVMTMKTLRGARLNDMRPYERDDGTFAQAAIRWVLQNDDVDGLAITMRSQGELDEYLGAIDPPAGAGSAPSHEGDLRLLAIYEALNHERQCVQGCGDCLDSCPASVDVSNTLRFGMYERDYGEPELARAQYLALERDASACLSCDGTPCAGACPTGVRLPEELRATHLRLTKTLAG